MRISSLALALILATAVVPGRGLAEIGWSPEQYEKAFGEGRRSYGKANERGYLVGQAHVVVEFSADNQASVAELWIIGVSNDAVPPKVLEAGKIASEGDEVARVTFTAESSIPANIRQAVVDDTLVRVDIRNQLLGRIALCGKAPPCSWWRRLMGACEPPAADACPILDRALSVDRTMDEMHRRAEEAVRRSRP